MRSGIQRRRKPVAIGLFISSTVCFVLAAIFFFNERNFVRNSIVADGKVIEMVRRDDGDHGTADYPVFVFRDRSGRKQTIHSSVGSYPPTHEVGDRVKVRYLPDSPRTAAIDDFSSLWLLSVVLIAVSISHLLVGLLFWNGPRVAGWFFKRAAVKV